MPCYGFGAGGGSTRASITELKPLRWLPSQNGLFWDMPQRQSEMVVRPEMSKSFPLESLITKFPVTLSGPLGLQRISTGSSMSCLSSKFPCDCSSEGGYNPAPGKQLYFFPGVSDAEFEKETQLLRQRK